MAQAGAQRVVTQSEGQRVVAQSGGQRVVAQSGGQRVAAQSGGQRVHGGIVRRAAAQAGRQQHKLEVYSTRGVSVAPLCLQLLIFSLPLPIGSLLSLPVSS